VALNGGAPCDESSLGETQSCALDACPSEITTTTMTITQGTSTTTPTSLSSTSSSGSITAPNGCAYVMTWPKVWQDLTFSSESKIIGPKASCATSCNEWTAFTCRGFLSAGPGRECILFGAVTGQILLSNQSIYDMYEPICPGDSVDYTVCSFVMVSSHVNMTAAGPGKFGGYFKFQSSCAELCIRNYGILPCAAFIYQWDNGKCTLYPNKLTGQTDSSSASDLYEKQCEIRQSPSG
uniref:Apple domain-containing protein n=1 Tax=Plectus sambesii TaxID=2011161 RepID=A0A914UTI2_9BILA